MTDTSPRSLSKLLNRDSFAIRTLLFMTFVVPIIFAILTGKRINRSRKNAVHHPKPIGSRATFPRQVSEIQCRVDKATRLGVRDVGALFHRRDERRLCQESLRRQTGEVERKERTTESMTTTPCSLCRRRTRCASAARD